MHFYILICILQSYWTHISVLIAFLFGRTGGLFVIFIHKIMSSLPINPGWLLLNFCQNSIDRMSSTVLDRGSKSRHHLGLLIWSWGTKAFTVNYDICCESHRWLFIRMRQLLWICLLNTFIIKRYWFSVSVQLIIFYWYILSYKLIFQLSSQTCT